MLDLHALYAACAPAAFRRAQALLGNDADAWDAVHDVFSRLAEQRSASALLDRPMAYVYRATTNTCLSVLETRRRRERQPAEQPGERSPHGEAVLAKDLLEKLDPHLDELDRRILVLWFLDDLPQEQIAEVLGVWRRTVGRRLARLRALAGEISEPLRRIS